MLRSLSYPSISYIYYLDPISDFIDVTCNNLATDLETTSSSYTD